MGNWRTANVVGTCDAQEVIALKSWLSADFMSDHWGPLHNGGVMGLPNFANTSFDVVGNLGERGFDEKSVADALEQIGKVVPSASIKVHLGGDYESLDIVATITLENGKAVIGPPEIAAIREHDPFTAVANLMRQLGRS